MGKLLAFPGTDNSTIGNPPSPRGRTLVIHERPCGDFVLMIEPRNRQPGWLDGWVARNAQDARRRAGDLCLTYPRLFARIHDGNARIDPANLRRGDGRIGWC